MYSTVNSIFYFSCFNPDYPTSGLTLTGLARVYCNMRAIFLLAKKYKWIDTVINLLSIEYEINHSDHCDQISDFSKA
jgi:hypothetical protein